MTCYSVKKAANSGSSSKPIYISPGYRLQIFIFANGYGFFVGQQLSVYARLTDEANSRPAFAGSVSFTLLNQLKDNKHMYKMAKFVSGKTDAQVAFNASILDFIPHSDLNLDRHRQTQYLKDDVLYFRVSIAIDDHKPWLSGARYI